MMRFFLFPYGMSILLVLELVVATGCQREGHDSLTIAVAANMQYAAVELVRTFEKQHQIECETVVGSSGKLTAQIMEGAPFDVFLSADMKYPDSLYERGLALGQPTVYAYGRLVLWTADKSLQPAVDILMKDRVRHVALANPKTAPYGEAAVSVLNHYGIFDAVKEKLVYGESIAQTNQFIVAGAAEIGFTSKSVVLSEEVGGKGAWVEVDPSMYEPIAQGVVVIAGRGNKVREAKKFRDFLLSAEGQRILQAYGYSTD